MVDTETTEKKIMDNMAEYYTRASRYWLDIFNSWAKTAGTFPQPSRAADTERNEEGSMDIFEFYTRASKYWLDVFNSWAKTADSLPQTFRRVDMENWLKPPWSDMAEWTKLYTGFTDMAKTMPLPFASMKDISETVAKGMNSYVKMYNAWLKGMASVAREGYKIGQKASIGEEVETAEFFETLKAAYDGITASVLESLKDTPFAGLKGLDEVVKDALDSLPEDDQKIGREFLQELFSFSVKMTNLSTKVMKEVSKTSADMLAKGTISGDEYKNLIDAYGETFKHAMEILREKAALLPGYKDIADDATSWAKGNLDLSISWLEMNLKLYQGVAKSSDEISKTAGELFKEGKISSADEFYNRWVEAYQQALDILVKNAQFSENIHKLMSSYAEWMKSMNKLYRSVMTPPYVTKEDFDRVSEELAKVKRKVKSSVEKWATVTAGAEEK